MTEATAQPEEKNPRTDYIVMTMSWPGGWARSENSVREAFLNLMDQEGARAADKPLRVIVVESPDEKGVQPYIDDFGALVYQKGAERWTKELPANPKLGAAMELIHDLMDSAQDETRWDDANKSE